MSSLISPEHLAQCTISSAFLWGICRSHFYQARNQTSLTDRIVHLVLGIIEAIPLVGQFVSLQEAKKNHASDQVEVERMFGVVKLMLKIEPQERKNIADIFAFLKPTQQQSA